ncbi:MAG: DUF4442 domain-containing protein [Chitinophagaceae bacterium]|nr:DUF4442 domain-containing protein [Chitinophagaceae bacterium]
MNPHFKTFQQQISQPWKFRLFLLRQLPAAFIAGLRLDVFDDQQASVRVRYGWLNQNPFRSMYFAVQSMAAEMSTGLLAFAQIYRRQPGVSMLVVGVEGNFFKKVTGTVHFICNDGQKIQDAIEACLQDGESRTITCDSNGINEDGETVANFRVTWSFKAKARKD